MVQEPTCNLPNIPQHVILRNQGGLASFSSEYDYLRYLQIIRRCAEMNHCQIHAYSLLPRQVQLLVTPSKADGVSVMLAQTAHHYLTFFRLRHGEQTDLWPQGFSVNLVRNGSCVINCMRYIEMTPVREGLCEHPSSYPWSSFRHNGYGEADILITPHRDYLALGETLETRLRSYSMLFEQVLGDGDGKTIAEPRPTAWPYAAPGMVLGGFNATPSESPRTHEPAPHYHAA